MASITIRNLDDLLKQSLRIRAAEHGRSMEEEAREILRASVSGFDADIPAREPASVPPDFARAMEEEGREILRPDLKPAPQETGLDLFERIHTRFARLGGVELEIPPRESQREPPDLGRSVPARNSRDHC